LKCITVKYPLHKCSEITLLLTPKVIMFHSHAPTYQSLLKQNTFHHVVKNSIQLLAHSGELCSRNCIAKRREISIKWIAFC